MDRYPLREGQPRWGNELAERQLDLALQAANLPGDVVRAIRPPLRQVLLFPKRVGLPSYQQRQIRIEDIIDVNRIFTDPRVTWTGTPAGYSGSSRNSMGNV
jgi:hypothetical protein